MRMASVSSAPSDPCGLVRVSRRRCKVALVIMSVYGSERDGERAAMVEDRKSNERAVRERRLILGGARSGKTAHAIALAKSLAAGTNADVIYIATAQALDEEMRHRISLHRAERPATWHKIGRASCRERV